MSNSNDTELAIEKEIFAAQYPDGATYSAGPQPGGIPGGPLVFLDRSDAERLANEIKGRVITRTWAYAVSFCLEKHYTLFVRHPDGRTSYIPKTVSKTPNIEGLIKVTD